MCLDNWLSMLVLCKIFILNYGQVLSNFVARKSPLSAQNQIMKPCLVILVEFKILG